MSLWDFVANLFKYFLRGSRGWLGNVFSWCLTPSEALRSISDLLLLGHHLRASLDEIAYLGSLVELQKWITAIARFYELESTLFVIVGQHRSRGVKISLHPFAVLFYCTLSCGWVAEAYSSGQSARSSQGHTERKTTICTHTTDNLQSPWGWREPENVERTHTDWGKTC